VSTSTNPNHKIATIRVKLDGETRAVEEAAARLVQDLTHFHRAVRSCESAQKIGLRITSSQLLCAVLLEKLNLALVSIWNEQHERHQEA
jgi:hypothetical protein